MPTLWRHIEDRFSDHALLAFPGGDGRDAAAVTACALLDLVGAAADLDGGPYAAFGLDVRRRRERQLLALASLAPVASVLGPEWRPFRIQMARLLARCHGAAAEERLVLLACLEHALGGSDDGALRVRAAMGPLAYSGLATLHELVDLVFDALSRALACVPDAARAAAS